MTTPEIWKPIQDFERIYEVSNHGRIQSLDHLVRSTNRWGPVVSLYRGRVLCSSVASNGYLQVTLSRAGVSHQKYPHMLVANEFLGPKPEGLLVLHGDGNKLNCSDWNLYYGTAKQNSEDSIRHGTVARGERQGCAKLTDEAVREIRRLAGAASRKDLAARFGVCKSTIVFVVKNQTWTHV